MRSVRHCFELIILLIVFGAALYTQRVAISDWVRARTAPELPAAVEYEEVGEEGALEVSEASEESEEAEEPTLESTFSVILNEPEASEGSQGDSSAPAAPQNNSDVPVEFNLAVPFTTQAPHADWSVPYKEACEEASLYMVHAYYQGMKEGQIDPDTATGELQKMIAFEKEIFGFYEDTTAEQIGTVAELMYGYATVETIDHPTVEQIKTHVAAGRPVIVPLAGRQLGNPFFTAPGPLYHMFVIRGYTLDGKFITNDPGTKHGEAYLYDFDTVISAMHDWNGGGEMTEGKKVVVVVYPSEKWSF